MNAILLAQPAAADVTPRPLSAPAAAAVHLWHAHLADWLPDADAAGELTQAEWERARRFVFERDRRRHLAGRRWLRRVLGGYLGLPPAAVPLTVNALGKPCLDETAAVCGLRFNLSHCEGQALLAVTSGREVGVDLEKPPADTVWPVLAQRCCTPEERDALLALPARQRPPVFVQIWTRKEALGKALGVGLSAAVCAQTVGPAARGRVRVRPAAGAVWEVWSLGWWGGLAAAVAVAATPTDPACVALRLTRPCLGARCSL